MFHRTVCLQRGMASTSHGQRRILKKSPPVQQYIRQAIESGTYPPDDDDDKQQQAARARLQQRKAPYGTKFRDLPVEYEILTLYPPIPPPPRIPRKQRSLRQEDSHLPTEHLVQAYLQRYYNEETKRQRDSALTQDEYYNRLLGIPPPSSASPMGQKSALLNKAYAFAVKQYQLLRQDDTLSEQDSIQMVNEMLQEEKTNERYDSRHTAKAIQQWSSDGSSFGSTSGGNDEKSENANAQQFDASSSSPLSGVPSILHSKPRAIEGMQLWSRRLQAVPYREWTIGASTALDHWIARCILELDEDTWQTLLEGESPELQSRGIDIITVRHSLFPETILDEDDDETLGSRGGTPDDEHVEPSSSSSSSSSWSSAEDKSIDELLASLGGFDYDDDDGSKKDQDDDDDVATPPFWSSSSTESSAGMTGQDDDDDLDAKVTTLVDELQVWRQKNVETPFEQWSTNEKDDFAMWLDTYVSTLASKREGQVDLVATRKALLDSPPIDNKDESDKFWQQVRDETEAEILLQSMRKTGAPSPEEAVTTSDRKARQAFVHFQDLPYNVQLQKLVELGTLRPLLDEYTSESDRIKFLARYGEKLMEGVEMEHLIPDPDGPIRGDELGRWGKDHDIGADERFRIERVEYGTHDFESGRLGQRSRQMYNAWNTQKAGRARFEETMFKKDRLGLRYNLDDKGKVRTSLQKERQET